MIVKTIIKENQRVCDICGIDKNVYNKCCVCGKDICFTCTRKEMFIPTAAICFKCFDDNEERQAIRKKYIKLHYSLTHKEEKELKKVRGKNEKR